MSLFDEIAAKLSGSEAGGSGGQGLVTSIVEMLSKQPGGQIPEGDGLKSAGLGLLLNLFSGGKADS